MKQSNRSLATATVLLLFGCTAYAQPPRDRDRDDRYHSYGQATLDRVRADLTRAEGNLHYIGEGEMRRFQDIQRNLAAFQRKWEHGRYDRDDIDHAIGELRGLVDRGHLRPRDRDLLSDDVRRLRELRERIDRNTRG